jgi:2-iminobutanoate/2-iminopropanoate deaminase
VISNMIKDVKEINNFNKYKMKKIFNTSNAPKPLGPYNQAVMANNMFFTSGQIAINPKNGELVLDNIKDETHQVMINLKEVLNSANIDFKNVVKSSIFISSMEDFNDINDVYGSYFNKNQAPARETVQVAKLPKGVNVEISMIAIIY